MDHESDDLDFEADAQDDGDALSLLLAETPANQGAALWE
jgi:hypothetical protein